MQLFPLDYSRLRGVTRMQLFPSDYSRLEGVTRMQLFPLYYSLFSFLTFYSQGSKVIPQRQKSHRVQGIFMFTKTK